MTMVAIMSTDAAQRRASYGGVVGGGKRQVDQAKEIFQHFGVPVYTRLPVLVNATFQAGLGVRYSLGMGWHAVVVPRL